MNKAKFSTIIIVIGFLLIAVLLFISLLITPHTEAGSGPLPLLTHTLPASTFVVTAYCPCELCCGEYADGLTASGRLAEGFLVAAPLDMPFGTLLRIPGYNNGDPVPVLDRGGAIKGNRLDLLFPTHIKALRWGRQYLKIERL